MPVACTSVPHQAGSLRRATDPLAVREATGFFKQFAQVLNDHLQGANTCWATLTIADFSRLA
jgi:hypothetical protein